MSDGLLSEWISGSPLDTFEIQSGRNQESRNWRGRGRDTYLRHEGRQKENSFTTATAVNSTRVVTTRDNGQVRPGPTSSCGDDEIDGVVLQSVALKQKGG